MQLRYWILGQELQVYDWARSLFSLLVYLFVVMIIYLHCVVILGMTFNSLWASLH